MCERTNMMMSLNETRSFQKTNKRGWVVGSRSAGVGGHGTRDGRDRTDGRVSVRVCQSRPHRSNRCGVTLLIPIEYKRITHPAGPAQRLGACAHTDRRRRGLHMHEYVCIPGSGYVILRLNMLGYLRKLSHNRHHQNHAGFSELKSAT